MHRSTIVKVEDLESNMELVEIDTAASTVSSSTATNNDETIRALIYTTCYNVLDG